MPIAASESLIHVSIQAETLFTIGPLHFTNSMVGALLASAILLVASWWFLRRAAMVPNRFQTAFELPIEWLAGIVAGSTSRWRSYVALVIGLFLMILIANWLGLLPGLEPSASFGRARAERSSFRSSARRRRISISRSAWPSSPSWSSSGGA